MTLTPSGTRLPLVMLGIITAFAVAVNIYLARRGFELSPATVKLWLFTFSYAVAWWIEVDRRLIRYSAPFEFSAFVFFAWPVVVPYYLYKTRGRRGIAWAIALLFAALLPDLALLATSLLVEQGT